MDAEQANRKLDKARKMMRQAEDDFHDELQEIFTPGTLVSWTHGDYRHFGRVQECVPHSGVVFVTNLKTGVSRRLDQFVLRVQEERDDG